ncbi:MAG: tetratricopeptide repeat protein [Candidatus Eremiobacteraeota bacterium]|nr:tetratricopeptide repeat protein [Candidatus Eremiobacteraeota bacterium]
MMRFVRSAVALIWLGVVPIFAIAQTPTVHVNPIDQTVLPSDPLDAIRSARESVAAGDLPGAIKHLERYVAGHRGEPDPARLLGDLYYRAGNFHAAESTYHAILAQYPSDKETHNRLGSVYATENRIDDAIAEFRDSLPGTDSVGNLVELYERKGQLGSYQNEIETEAHRFPTQVDLQIELGEIYRLTFHPEQAIIAYRRALDNDPRSLQALNGLGLAYLDQHDYPTAERYFNDCLGQAPTTYSCVDNLAAAYLETGRFDEAEAQLTKARRLEPEMPEAIVNLGYLVDARGQWRRAVAYYVEALTVYPYSTDAYFDLGNAYEKHQQYSLAQSVLLKGLVVAPSNGRLHFLLGQTYADQHEDALAGAQFTLAAGSNDPDVKRLARIRVGDTKP